MREMKKLGELGDVFIGLTYKPEDVVDEDGTIVLRSSNIQDGKLDFGDIVRVSCNVRDKLWVKENDILMCSRNGSAKLVGKTALISNLQEDMTFGAFMTIIRTPYNGYLQYFFKSPMFRRQLNSSATTTINQITRSMLDNIDVPVFDNDTADNIKAILGKCEKIIQERKEEINALDDLIKARFVELFGDAEKMIPLSSLCDVSGGYSFKSGDITSDGAVKILQIGNVYLDDVNWEITNYLPEGYDETYSRFLLNEGDIVIALTRPIIQSLGNVKACIVKDSDMPCLLNQRVGRIVPKKNIEVSLKFIYGCLMTEGFTRYVESCCIGCSQPNISTKDIENYLIPDVSFNEQMEFVNFKEQVDKSKVVVKKALDETQVLFDSLMQKYFG